MTLEQAAMIAGDIMMIGGAFAMMIFVGISIYILIIMHKINTVFKSLHSGYETVQEVLSIPLMLLAGFLTKKSIKK